MILQFGAGNFLRAFADLFIDQLNRDPGTAVGPIVAVQSTGRERADALNEAGGCYHVAIQGFHEGGVVNETERVSSLARALHAGTEWEQILGVARDPRLTTIVSNTTEAGLSLDETDVSRGEFAPESFPAKLLSVLLSRFEAGGAGLWILPCELIEANGARLLALVDEQAVRWGISPDTRDWLRQECRWVNTLVDRIVPGPPRDHPLRGVDPLLVSAEPFAFWAVEMADPNTFPLKHPAIVAAPDITPFWLRKVRILNAAHSALVCKAPRHGVATVREAVEHPEMGPWLERLLSEEIVPVLRGRCDDPDGFARAVLDRFRNPFLEHRLDTIALNHDSKVAVRLRPTWSEYREQFGCEPPLLSGILG